MDALISLLIRLRYWQILVIGVVSAIIISEFIVVAIDILWDGKISGELIFAGFLTPLLDAFIILIIFVAIIAKLKESYEELKSAQAQLIHAGRLSSLGEMSAGIAHEINQPLHIIRLKSQSLLVNADEGLIPTLSKEVTDVLQTIDSQVERISKIITHLRIFARTDSLNDTKPIDINQPLKNVFLLIGESLRLKDITVRKEFYDAPLMITADASRLEQVFLNIIQNAKDAMEKLQGDTPKILTVSSLPGEDDTIEVRISDNGGGIPVEIREKVFEPFFTTKEVGKGTGLGLSIAYNIVRDMGGNIEFHVDEGVGTTFILTFPNMMQSNARDNNPCQTGNLPY
jgi:C4-dicarboxylate-specific signal transduction histidine kinase